MEKRIKSPAITKAGIPVTDELDMLSLIKVYGRNSNDCMRIEINQDLTLLFPSPSCFSPCLLIFCLLLQKKKNSATTKKSHVNLQSKLQKSVKTN